MEFTISQIGSASPHWVPRYMPPANAGVRAGGGQSLQTTHRLPEMPAGNVGRLETEYDQFGRFGVSAGTPADVAEDPSDHRPAINPTKHFRSGEATAGELYSEYLRSLLDSSIDPDGETGARRFIPAFMTEYQVYQLNDFQYRWEIEVERRRILAGMQDTSPHPAAEEVASVDGSPASTGFGR